MKFFYRNVLQTPALGRSYYVYSKPVFNNKYVLFFFYFFNFIYNVVVIKEGLRASYC